MSRIPSMAIIHNGSHPPESTVTSPGLSGGSEKNVRENGGYQNDMAIGE